ncbi:hypothetical protein CHUAL_007986 [Chamberlinius hualienensis]
MVRFWKLEREVQLFNDTFYELCVPIGEDKYFMFGVREGNRGILMLGIYLVNSQRFEDFNYLIWGRTFLFPSCNVHVFQDFIFIYSPPYTLELGSMAIINTKDYSMEKFSFPVLTYYNGIHMGNCFVNDQLFVFFRENNEISVFRIDLGTLQIEFLFSRNSNILRGVHVFDKLVAKGTDIYVFLIFQTQLVIYDTGNREWRIEGNYNNRIHSRVKFVETIVMDEEFVACIRFRTLGFWIYKTIIFNFDTLSWRLANFIIPRLFYDGTNFTKPFIHNSKIFYIKNSRISRRYLRDFTIPDTMPRVDDDNMLIYVLEFNPPLVTLCHYKILEFNIDIRHNAPRRYIQPLRYYITKRYENFI